MDLKQVSFQIFLCAILVTAVRTRVDLESPGNRKRFNMPFSSSKFLLLVQDLLMPLEIEDLTATLITLHNSGLVDLSHVQVQGTAVAECHRITSGTFERS